MKAQYAQEISAAHLRHMEPVFDHRLALDQARYYLYHRPDTPAGGYMWGWKTNSDNKQEMMNGLRDMYACNQLFMRSWPLIEEMGEIIQLQGDQRDNARSWILENEIVARADAELVVVHGF